MSGIVWTFWLHIYIRLKKVVHLMDEKLIEKLDNYIRERLTAKRYRHTMGVVETAVAERMLKKRI